MATELVLAICITLLSACDGVKTFPPGFMFGAASASYHGDGKNKLRESIILGNSTADVAANLNNKWKHDIKIASELGLDFYRFSVSWPRLFPTGLTKELNEAGAKYYSDLIDGLLETGIEPIVTLHHWELPVNIQNLGGWANPKILDWFEDYAQRVFALYADRVKIWLTFDEPLLICDIAYVNGILSPGIKEDQLAPYICNKNVLMAHAKAYRIYDRQFKGLYGGRISIANQLIWFESESPGNENLAQLIMEYMAGRYFYPIFSKQGGWPPTVEEMLRRTSDKQGYNTTRLPTFTAAQKTFIRGTADFIGLNYYTGRTVRQAKPGAEVDISIMLGSYYELNAVMRIPPDAYMSASRVVYPKGIRHLLSWVKRSYGDWQIFITEHGYPTAGVELQDYDRVLGLREHLQQIYLSIYEDGVDVVGYTLWSLMDSFEWINGSSIRFGLYQMDFDGSELKIEPRLSSKYYTCIIENNSFDVPKECFDIEGFNDTEVRVKRQINLTNLANPNNVANGIELTKEVYENRRCIIKVMGMMAKMMSLIGNN